MSAVRKTSGLGQLAAISVRDAANALQSVERGSVRDDGNVSRVFFSSMAASVDPDSVRGYGNDSGTVTVTTPSASVTVAGGVAPFTYAWTRTDGGSQPWTITAPTAATTAFSSDLDANQSEAASFICTVTDATGATAATGVVNAHAVNLGGGLVIGPIP